MPKRTHGPTQQPTITPPKLATLATATALMSEMFPSITDRRKRAYLAAYATCGKMRTAAPLAGIHWTTHYKWMASDPAYAAAFPDAKRMIASLYEDAMFARGVEGYDEPVFFLGEICGTKKRYSDQLLITGLKALMPEEYRDRQEVRHEVSEGMRALLAAWDEPAVPTPPAALPPGQSWAPPEDESAEDEEDEEEC